jgi:predicted negative regulator of RcsB-dependent stress response
MLYPNWENEMTTGEIGMLTLIIGALTLFGGVLGWASWQEARQRRKTQKG